MKSTGNLTYQSCIYVASFLYTVMILTELSIPLSCSVYADVRIAISKLIDH